MNLAELMYKCLTYKDEAEFLGMEPIGEGGTIIVPKGHEFLTQRGLATLVRECNKNSYKFSLSPFGDKVVIYFRRSR